MQKVDKFFDKVDEILYKFQFVLSSIFFIGMVSLTIANVFCRLFLNKSILWSEEITYACFNWAVFIGICLVYKNQGLVAVGALVDRLPKTPKRVVMTFVFLFVFVMNVCLTIWGAQLTLQGRARFTPAIHLCYAWIDLSVVVGFAMLSYYSLRFLIKELRGQEIQEAALEERS